MSMIFNTFMQETLQQYVSRVMREKNLSGYDVERQSRKGISQSHIHRVQNGEVKNLSAVKIKALARGLGVPEAELSAITLGSKFKIGDLAHARLADIDFAYEGMPKKKKERADVVIEMLEREIKRINDEPD